MDPAYVLTHVEEDRRHWWFRGRLAVLLATLRHALPPRPLRLLELGCGTGNVLGALGEFGQAIGIESRQELCGVAQAAGLDVRAGSLPDDVPVERGWADVVLLRDVLAHLDDERSALTTARAALAPGGLLMITVPAYSWLWSAHDVALGHRRRYTAARLRRVLECASFEVVRVSYFGTVLLPALVAVRVTKRLLGDQRHDLRRPPPLLNDALERVFAFERHLVPRFALPFGSSILALARA